MIRMSVGYSEAYISRPDVIGPPSAQPYMPHCATFRYLRPEMGAPLYKIVSLVHKPEILFGLRIYVEIHHNSKIGPI